MIQVFLCPLDDFRMQIAGELIPNLYNADWITHRRYHVQQYDLGMKMAGQECGLTNRLELGIRNVNWKKNFIHYAHSIPKFVIRLGYCNIKKYFASELTHYNFISRLFHQILWSKGAVPIDRAASKEAMPQHALPQ